MKLPDFTFEKKYWNDGFSFVIGVDEVGRGAFAGPVIAAAATLKSSNHPICQSSNKNGNLLEEILKLAINDSKKLSAKKREKLESQIKKYFHCAIGICDVPFINSFGIVKATERAIRMAISKLISEDLRFKNNDLRMNQESIDRKSYLLNHKSFLLIDAFHVKYVPIIGLNHQQAIIHGDQKSVSIAAASIVAKVYRDQIMRDLSIKYVQYRWDENKGYGTSEHREAIRRYGICNLHRKQFVRSWLTL